MQALERTAADLPLAPALEVWGVERAGDVYRRLDGAIRYVVVTDGAGGGRILPASLVLGSDPERMLDLVAGGEEALSVDADTPETALPPERPLVVRRAGSVAGVLEEERPAPRSRAEERLAASGGDARAAALEAVQSAREVFRKRGVALVLDIQPSRVACDPQLVRDLVHELLDVAWQSIEQAGGGTGVHVVVSQGLGELWLAVEDHGTRARVLDLAVAFSDDPTEDPGILAIRRLHDRVRRAGGEMRAVHSRAGTRFLACLPAPTP